LADLDIPQDEADALIAVDKHPADHELHLFPGLGGRMNVELISGDHREHFYLDATVGRLDLRKVTLQNRARSVIILLRLDLKGAPHRNPDGTELECPHLHIYREGYGDKWAFAVPPGFSDLDDAWQTLQDFMQHCNIVEVPDIRRELGT
jgi:hypothetical protein